MNMQWVPTPPRKVNKTYPHVFEVTNESDAFDIHVCYSKINAIPRCKYIILVRFTCYTTHPGIAILTRGSMQVCLTAASRADQ